MKELNRRCPICESVACEILHHQKFRLSDTSILPNGYDVVSCDNCGFVYADTPGNQELYNRYYSEYSKYEDTNSLISTGGGTSVWDKKRIETTARDIARHVSKASTILDIGCANGGLLLELKKAGFQNLYGLDPSKVCVNYVKDLGLHCFLGELFEATKQLHGQRFDSIILSHVLEHIYDVKKAASIVRELLNENGTVYIEVPDASNYCQHYIVPYYYFDSEHINHFDRHSLMNLFASEGFELLATESKSFYVNDTTLYPAVYTIFRITSDQKQYAMSKNENVKNEVQRFIEISKNNSSNEELERLANTQEPIVIFGAGNFTARLLQSTPLKHCNIVAFVDNDKKKQNTTFSDRSVHSPEFVKNFSGTIVVCSALFYNQIISQLKSDLGLRNHIITVK